MESKVVAAQVLCNVYGYEKLEWLAIRPGVLRLHALTNGNQGQVPCCCGATGVLAPANALWVCARAALPV